MQISGQNYDIGKISAFESGKLYALHVADTNIVLVRASSAQLRERIEMRLWVFFWAQ